jgi:hypothetical protein
LPLSSVNCSRSLVADTQTQYTVFNFFQFITFDSLVKYSGKAVCPFIFKNASLNQLKFTGLVDSFLLRNLWTFDQVDPKEATINSRINLAFVSGYNYRLDPTILNSRVFEFITSVVVSKSAFSTQSDLFKSLSYLQYVTVSSVNSLSNFFHKIGIEWTLHLPDNCAVMLTDFDSDSWSVYTLPDHDFCLFSKFPFSKPTVAILDLSGLSKCTSTIRWLTQNYQQLNLTDMTNKTRLIYKMCLAQFFLFNGTFFQEKLDSCAVNENKSQENYNKYAEYYQVESNLKLIDALTVFVLIPIGSILGLVLNIQVVRTIDKYHKTYLKEDFYKFMRLSSVFNCLYCLIFAFYPVNNCMDTRNNYFCSSITSNLLVQYYKIVCVAFLGETTELCANIAYILITVNRYMLIGREHSPLLERISNLELKNVAWFSVAFSSIVNIGHLFFFFLFNLKSIMAIRFAQRPSRPQICM